MFILESVRKTAKLYLPKAKNICLFYNAAILFLGLYPTELSVYVHQNMYKSVQSSFIQNSQLLGIAFRSPNKKMGK